MAEPIGSAAGGHPDLHLTTEEKRVYGELLKEADPDGFGAVSGDVAVKFFERTKLPADVLGQIWQIADTENRGFLTPSGFGVVLRLIGHAQAGRVPTPTLAPQPAPLPRFENNNRPPPIAAPPPLAAQYSGTPSSPTVASSGGPIRVPALTPDKVNEYSGLFDKSGAENGYLSGLVAKQIFERARLPNELLGRIWNLADTQGRGSLDVTEFVIAMHLLASCKSGAMRGVPNTLPPGLYEAAARRPQPRMPVSPRPSSASGPPPSIPPQFTGYGVRPQSPGMRQQPSAPLSAQSTGDGWAVTPADKARFDQAFATVDRQNTGYINGEQAVTFFSNARLPEETLAQIWDLADISSEGRLSRDEFAVAMYLIKQQKASKDGRGILPAKLPPALIPPSMRRQIHPPSHSTAPAFETAPITQPRSAAEDLFGLDVLSPLPSQPAPQPQPAPAQVPQSTGGTDVGPFGSPKSPTITPAASTAASSIFRPFQPSSSFGQSMIPQSTGSPAPNQSRSLSVPQASEDLLGDSDASVSAKLTNETAELGNLSNQVGSLSKEMTDLQGKRAQADQELSQNAQQKRTFETRLSQLRAAFDKEVKEFKALQEQLTTSRNETKRLQQDMAMIEGSHADTKRQHDQLRAAYEADQQENLSLKEKIRQINSENDQLKPQIEKLKSDARQQKGLVAINKKQLATNELERDRLQNEHKAAQKEVDDANREIEETNRQLEASRKALEETRSIPKPTMPVHAPAQAPVLAPVPVAAAVPLPEARSPPLASPTPSTMSNPFMRREGSTVFSPPLGSPEPNHDHSAFDSIFGPSFGPPLTEAPSTSFRSATPTDQITSHENTAKIEHSTPTSVTSPDIVEPPAPPTGRQITSDSLPLRRTLERTESMTSSVKVVPPTSRLSPVDTPRAATPIGSSALSTDTNASDPFAMAAADEEQESVRRTLPRFDTDDKGSSIPGAFPSHTPRTETPVQNVNPTTVVVGAAAAAMAAGTGLGIATTQQAEEEKKEQKTPSPPADTKASNFDEFFGGPAHQRTPSEQVKDFDAAFASLGPSSVVPNGTAKAGDKEFPDIKELDDNDDDESSVYSEETPLGFDDDFNTQPTTQTAPVNVPGTLPPSIATSSVGLPAVGSSNAAGKQPAVASAIPGYLQPRPTLSTASSNASSLPGFEQQKSPPGYNDSVPQDNPAHFPMEYKGLLPTREDPTSPTLPSSSEPSSNAAPPTYGPEAAQSQEEAVAQTMSSPTASKPTAFDFDSVFAGMAPAQVTEDDSDEETALGSPRAQVPEFDPNFDSPIQSRSMTSNSIAQSPVTTHSAVTTHDAVTTNGTTSNTNTSSSGFFGFNDSIATAAPSQRSYNNAPPAISHDWDALFAPLSSPPPLVGTTGPGTDAQTSNAEPQRTEISPEVNARTSFTEVSGTSTPLAPGAATHLPLPPSNLKLDKPANDKSMLERPAPGRALSGGTEHDDPILKRLTAMGWSRTDSLAALEKYDYNIDKAADYLTFRS